MRSFTCAASQKAEGAICHTFICIVMVDGSTDFCEGLPLLLGLCQSPVDYDNPAVERGHAHPMVESASCGCVFRSKDITTRMVSIVKTCAWGGAEYAKSREAKERALREAQEAKETERRAQRLRMAEVGTVASPVFTLLVYCESCIYINRSMVEHPPP